MRPLSKKIQTLIVAGASTAILLAQFLQEKEGNRLSAYQDGANVWTICRGATRVDGQPVRQGLQLSREKCEQVNKMEVDKAIAWVEQHIKVPLTDVQKAGIASFCPYNIGAGKCTASTFYRKLNAGDTLGACAEIKRWIFDGGKDCRIRANNCAGQPLRRAQESVLSCWGLDA
ncbi:lysozyme [Candidatus Fukatsuia symbiotica]|uniref:Lysozyme n=1 Tax=Candidatus Fukatsuia symbiotica TaxID=1878942 RepID=A0A2U8I6H5_9GAMM|nr:lysozyme [Candidatus Fukatsuia symbiotica]AWK13477.1 lysozyme [Candidatus Fukatsuia symbiotica]AWK14748.1 lysozyme [Candidatus Fukatsuia symbiotica]MEA9444383.1 lysozyme [Candidatus Fukatsuia symbiotica]MEA9445080.1 lysozyme [Candidatus Fukatsuia symbiotica]